MNSEEKPRGRPIKYFTEEKRKDAIRQSKTRYMSNKEWICIVCDDHNYTLSGKCKHLRTKKHIKNKAAYDVMNKIINIIHKK